MAVVRGILCVERPGEIIREPSQSLVAYFAVNVASYKFQLHNIFFLANPPKLSRIYSFL